MTGLVRKSLKAFVVIHTLRPSASGRVQKKIAAREDIQVLAILRNLIARASSVRRSSILSLSPMMHTSEHIVTTLHEQEERTHEHLTKQLEQGIPGLEAAR